MQTYRNDIVLCGLPRSGSTLLYSLLKFCVTSHWLQQDEYSYNAVISSFFPEKSNNDVLSSNPFYKDFNHIFNQPYSIASNVSKAEPFISKQPYDIFRAQDNIIPEEVPLIITIRDLRDVLISKHKALSNKGIDDYFIYPDYKYTFTKSSAPEKNGPGLLKYCQAIKNILENKTRKRLKNVYLCHYEELVSYPDKVQGDLKELGISYKQNIKFSDWDTQVSTLSKKNSFSHFATALGELRVINKKNINKWQDETYAAHIKKQLNRFPELVMWLKYFGYN